MTRVAYGMSCKALEACLQDHSATVSTHTFTNPSRSVPNTSPSDTTEVPAVSDTTPKQTEADTTTLQAATTLQATTNVPSTGSTNALRTSAAAPACNSIRMRCLPNPKLHAQQADNNCWVLHAWKCDGEQDCKNGEDEDGCSATVATVNLTLTTINTATQKASFVFADADTLIVGAPTFTNFITGGLMASVNKVMDFRANACPDLENFCYGQGQGWLAQEAFDIVTCTRAICPVMCESAGFPAIVDAPYWNNGQLPDVCIAPRQPKETVAPTRRQTQAPATAATTAAATQTSTTEADVPPAAVETSATPISSAEPVELLASLAPINQAQPSEENTIAGSSMAVIIVVALGAIICVGLFLVVSNCNSDEDTDTAVIVQNPHFEVNEYEAVTGALAGQPTQNPGRVDAGWGAALGGRKPGEVITPPIIAQTRL